MEIKINPDTKDDATVVEGLSFDRYASNKYMICQLDVELLSTGSYCELTCEGSSEASAMFALAPAIKGISFTTSGIVGYWAHNGNRFPGDTTYGSTWGINDVIGVGFLGNKMRFWKNGVAQPELSVPTVGYRYPSVLSSTDRSVRYSGTFHVYGYDIQYLPDGYVPLGGLSTQRPKWNVPTSVLMSILPASLTRGFR